MGKFGFSFSAKRALGISAAKGRVSRAIGVPLTKSGRQRKIGRMVTGGGGGSGGGSGCGCLSFLIFMAAVVWYIVATSK